MPSKSPILHLLCGKIASGKSTLAKELAQEDGAVIIAEDVWLHTLYSDQMTSIADYVRCSAKLRQAMGPHIASLLNTGTSVVLDFQANTVQARSWMRSILEQTHADHKLHILDVPDAVCLKRLAERNAAGNHQFAPTKEQFEQLSKHFVFPTYDEGFEIVIHKT